MVRIGITGHQRLNDSTAWSWVESAINHELDTLPPPFLAVSSLAIGADQRFASLVARRGGQIHAVIPFEGYDQTLSPEDAEVYRRILSQAHSIDVLQKHGTNEDAYLAAGKRVVELSDMMVAVWDGHPAKGKGGTADIVAYAEKRNVPVFHLNPAAKTTTRRPVDLRYSAFLASRMYPHQSALNDLRMEIHRLGVSLDRPVWVAEVAAQELNEKPSEEVQIACMRHVREIPAFICIVDGSYGKPWNIAQLCVLELEIIAATLARKPFHFFLLAPYEGDPRTESLLRVIRLMRPELVTAKPQSAEEILENLAKHLTKKKRGPHFLERGPAVSPGALWKPDLNIQFLNEVFVPLNQGQPDEASIRALLSDVSPERDEATRLVYLWMAIRHLCAAPYNDLAYQRFLPLWDRALSLWASAASWYGLHGVNFLGRLAAVNTLLRIRERISSSGELSIQGSKGALASEYYSISKGVRSRQLKRKLLDKAVVLVSEAFKESQTDPSGLFAIRGSVLQASGRFAEGLRDYQEVLRLRQSRGDNPGVIGEAESELGWGFFQCWLHRRFFALGYLSKAQHFLKHGAELLENSGRHAFSVRALRKLGLFYAFTFRFFLARRVLERAHDLASREAVQDQLRQLLPSLKILRKVTWIGKGHKRSISPSRNE